MSLIFFLLFGSVAGFEVKENGFDLSRDGKRLATWQGRVRVWDTQTGAEAVTLEGPTNAGYGTRFSPDGSELVVGKIVEQGGIGLVVAEKLCGHI